MTTDPSWRRLKDLSFATMYGAGDKRYRAQVFGSFFDGTLPDRLEGESAEQAVLRRGEELLADMQNDLTYVLSGQKRLEEILEGSSPEERAQRLQKLTNLHHTLENGMADWKRQLDEWGVSIVE